MRAAAPDPAVRGWGRGRAGSAGPRGGGAAVLFSENRQREIGHIVNFTVRGNF